MKKIIMIGLCMLLIGCSSNQSSNQYTQQDLYRFYNGGYEDGYWACKKEDYSPRLYALEREVFLKEIAYNLSLGSINLVPSNVTLAYDNMTYIVRGNDLDFIFENMTCQEVRCDCMDWGCMAYCMECK